MLSKTVKWERLRSQFRATGKSWHKVTTFCVLGIPIYVHKEEQQ